MSNEFLAILSGAVCGVIAARLVWRWIKRQ